MRARVLLQEFSKGAGASEHADGESAEGDAGPVEDIRSMRTVEVLLTI